ncbi:export associated protein [Streptomyces alfalfae]|uniref:Export associated protein n=1 Tax=Streptomyces alfalfae TaxID=1642299 RepID=A0A1P8TML1_9ACTN|nr:TerD family protein [Streptomyces alfalfae]AYA19296.1 export associated protein [Streptomyces fradiae]APY88877.1 export associated protein [Streptomyces alfalfae]QQC88719.1 TerD family protein [Streptomyces alfalfae]RXX36122.1 export associated protein [Streptomyces alfalfae]RZN03868.1 export associated protein [Streptomyces alfalfae]
MAAELVRGQNHPLPWTRLEIRVSAGEPVVAGATLGDDRGKVRGVEWVAHPGSPALPGLEVSQQAAAEHRLAVDLGALPDTVHRVSVLLALPVGVGGPVSFRALPAPFVSVTGLDGAEVAGYTITDLDTESAVVALELYRRQDAWKVRAVGQGYAGGLADLLTDQGLPEARELAGAIEDAVARGLARSVATPPPRPADGTRVRTAPHGRSERSAPAGPADAARDAGPQEQPAPAPRQPGGPVDYTHPGRRASAPPPPPPVAPAAHPGQAPRPVAGDATGWSMEERLYNQVWGMFEDLARTTAAYRSAVDFADSRMEQELDKVLSDPRSRIGGPGDAARDTARAKHADLTGQARAALDRDLAQLAAEADVVEPALPPAFAAWSSPVWQAYRAPMEIPMALRLGDLHLPERIDLRIPMLVRLPLERGLWIDSGKALTNTFTDAAELRRLAVDTAVAHTARLLAAYPAGEFSVHVIDAAGSAAAAFAPLVSAGVPARPPASGAAGVSEVLARLTRRVDLVQMAVRGGAADALPPDLDVAEQLLIVNDFPHGFDDRAVTRLRYLADEGPAVGVHLMMVADREDAAEYGPLLDPLWRALLRLTPVPDDHLADPWVGHTWTYDPPVFPQGSDVLRQVLDRVAAARRNGGR